MRSAKSVDDSYSSLEGTFDANDTSDDEDSENEDSEEDSSTSSSTYPDEVIKVLRTLDDGEVAPDSDRNRYSILCCKTESEKR